MRTLSSRGQLGSRSSCVRRLVLLASYSTLKAITTASPCLRRTPAGQESFRHGRAARASSRPGTDLVASERTAPRARASGCRPGRCTPPRRPPSAGRDATSAQRLVASEIGSGSPRVHPRPELTQTAGCACPSTGAPARGGVRSPGVMCHFQVRGRAIDARPAKPQPSERRGARRLIETH
jgi:hypothetical protein